MVVSDTRRSRRLRVGCGVAVALIVVLLAVVASLVGLALTQTRSDTVSARKVETELPPPSSARVRIELDIAVAHLIVLPAEPGEPVRADADYDDRRYELVQETLGDAEAGWVYRLRFGPRRSPMWELFKVKLGGPLSKLRLTLPRGVPLELVGEIDSGFATFELGGLRVDSTELNVNRGAVNVSIWEPLEAPMDRISVTGNKGALQISGLGNASPRSASFDQKLGPLDLDFRGAWSRDASIRIAGHIAAGTVWLPDNANVEGVDRSTVRRPAPRPELPRPTLRLDVAASPHQILFIE